MAATKATIAESWIYFVRYQDMIKIGCAQFPRARFFALKGASRFLLNSLGLREAIRSSSAAFIGVGRRIVSAMNGSPQRPKSLSSSR